MLLAALGFAVLLVLAMVFLIQGPPFVASNDESAEQMLALIKRRRPRRILDMGSGDGKLVILLAQQGYQVEGIELNPLLVWRSRRAIKRAGLNDKAAVKWGNFWTCDVSGHDTVTLYAVRHVMPRLEKKLRAELRPGASIVSNYFVFPNLKPAASRGRARLYTI